MNLYYFYNDRKTRESRETRVFKIVNSKTLVKHFLSAFIVGFIMIKRLTI
jgi:hypothetical protein